MTIRRDFTVSRRAAGLLLSLSMVAAACSRGGDAGRADTATTSGEVTTTTIDDAWKDEVAADCDDVINALSFIPEHDGSVAGVAAFIAAHRAARERLRMNDGPHLPAEVPVAPQEFDSQIAKAEAALSAAESAIATGDLEAATASLNEYFPHLFTVARLLAIAGAPCGDAVPARAASAELYATLDFATLTLTAGFGSIWVTEHDGRRVARVDADTGEVLAVIDVGVEPIKLQPASGRMWGRTSDSFFAIDPATNTVTTKLLKSDVGPEADRAWAVEGALWVCDGPRLHRFDPTTVERVAVLDLGIACDFPGGTTDLIVASSFDADEAQSGAAAAAFIDPGTNQVLATTKLPVDVNIGVVLDDAVFFAPEQGAQAVVVDRTTFTVTATPSLGRPIAPGTVESDGDLIYVPTADERDVLVVDATTFRVVDTIGTLGSRSVTIAGASIWVCGAESGIIQRFPRKPG